jgi:hypothetical protein
VEIAVAPAEGWQIDEERLFHLRSGAPLLSLLLSLLVQLALEERIHIRFVLLCTRHSPVYPTVGT